MPESVRVKPILFALTRPLVGLMTAVAMFLAPAPTKISIAGAVHLVRFFGRNLSSSTLDSRLHSGTSTDVLKVRSSFPHRKYRTNRVLALGIQRSQQQATKKRGNHWLGPAGQGRGGRGGWRGMCRGVQSSISRISHTADQSRARFCRLDFQLSCRLVQPRVLTAASTPALAAQ